MGYLGTQESHLVCGGAAAEIYDTTGQIDKVTHVKEIRQAEAMRE
jgi:hypothetical protein